MEILWIRWAAAQSSYLVRLLRTQLLTTVALLLTIACLIYITNCTVRFISTCHSRTVLPFLRTEVIFCAFPHPARVYWTPSFRRLKKYFLLASPIAHVREPTISNVVYMKAESAIV